MKPFAAQLSSKKSSALRPRNFLPVMRSFRSSWGWSRPQYVTQFEELPTIHSSYCPEAEVLTVKNILIHKDRYPRILHRHVIEADQPKQVAVKKMMESDVNSVVVTDNRQVIGIVTEQDFFRREGQKCEEFMTADPICVTRRATLDECVSRMLYHNFRHLVVVSSAWFSAGDMVEEDDIIAVLSMKDVIQIMNTLKDRQSLEESHAVSKTLNRKAKDLDGGIVYKASLSPDHTAADALQIMKNNKKNIVLVSDHEELIGVVCPLDLFEKVLVQKIPPEDVKLKDVYTEGVISMQEDDRLDRALTLFAARRVRNIPVLDKSGSKVVGIFNTRDLLRELYA